MSLRCLQIAAVVLALAGCYHIPGEIARPGEPVKWGRPRLVRRPVASDELPSDSIPMVRVRLTTGNKVTVSSILGLTLACGTARIQVSPGQSVELAADGGLAAKFEGRPWQRFSDTLACQPFEPDMVSVAGRPYHGSLLVFASPDNDLVVINRLPLEEYLYGVVPCEIGPCQPATIEALKAQAVAARSFSMARMAEHRYPGFDLWDSFVRDQEYRGARPEKDVAIQAVDATRGQVIEYGGEVAAALYHANCGGTTSDGSQPFLRSIRDTPGGRRGTRAYCSDRPNFTWRVIVSRERLETALGLLVGRGGRVSVKSFRLDKDQRSGRVKYVNFATGQGNLRVHGNDLRTALALKSQNFEMSKHGNQYTIDGRGYGHGSGMCQDGAVGMARAGRSYTEILYHYYTGIRLVKKY